MKIPKGAVDNLRAFITPWDTDETRIADLPRTGYVYLDWDGITWTDPENDDANWATYCRYCGGRLDGDDPEGHEADCDHRDDDEAGEYEWIAGDCMAFDPVGALLLRYSYEVVG